MQTRVKVGDKWLMKTLQLYVIAPMRMTGMTNHSAGSNGEDDRAGL